MSDDPVTADEPRTHWAGVVIPDPDKREPVPGGTVTPCGDGCGRWRAESASGLVSRFDSREDAAAWLCPCGAPRAHLRA